MAYVYDKRRIGERLRKRREMLGITQEQAAEQIDKSLNFYVKVELGQMGMSLETVFDICNAFDLRPDEILLDPVDDSTLANITRISKAISNLSPQRQETIIELIKVYLRDVSINSKELS